VAKTKTELLLEKLDTLSKKSDQSKHGREKVKLLVDLSSEFCRSDPERAEDLAKKALSLSKKLGFEKGRAESHLDIGMSHWVRGNYREALGAFERALAICEKIGDEKGAASCHSNIGIIHRNRGDYQQAIECYLKALEIKERIGDKRGIARAYNNIGIVYDERNDFDRALKYYQLALDIFMELEDKLGIGISFNNIGTSYESKGDLESALEYYHKSLEIKEEIGDRKGLADAYMNIGAVCENKHEFISALDFASRALDIFEAIDDKKGIAESHSKIGRIHARLERFDSASVHLRQGLMLARKLETKELEASCLENLSELHRAQGDYEKALEYHKRYSELKEKIFSDVSAQNIARMQVKFDTEKKEKEADIYRGIFENTVMGMYRISQDGQILMANTALIEMLGYADFDDIAEQNLLDESLSQSTHPRSNFRTLLKRDGTVLGLESCWFRKDGSMIFVQESTRAVKDNSGIVIHYEGVVEDITERKTIEQSLKENEEKYRLMVESISDGFFTLVSENLIIDFINPIAEELLQCKAENVVGKPIFDAFPQAKGSIFEEKYRQAFKQKKTLSFETYFGIAPLDNWYDVRVYSSDQGLSVFFRLTTEHKRVEARLIEMKEFTETALDSQLDTFFVFEPSTGKAVRWNRVFREVSGYTDEEIADMPAPSSYYSPEDLEKAKVFTQEVLKRGSGTIELELICKDGSTIPTEYRVSVINDDQGNPKYLISVGSDITERHQAEQTLRAERDRAQKYLDIAGVLFVALNSKGNITLANVRAGQILGYTHDEIIGMNWFDNFIPERMREDTKRAFATLMATDVEPVEYYENPILTKDGSERIIAWHNTTLQDQDGSIIGVLSSGEDITEQKRVIAALRESEEKFRILVQHQGEGITAVDEDEIFIFANPAAERIMGVEPGGLIGRSLAEFVDQETFEYLQDQTRARKQGKSTVYTMEIVRADGRKRQLVVTGTPKFSSDGKFTGTYGIFRDITDQKEVEEALKQSEERLRSTIASMDDLVFVIDKNGVFVEYYQPTGKQDLYSPPDQFIGKSFNSVMPSHVSKLTERAIKAVEKTDESQRIEYPMQIAGREMWFNTTLSARRDNRGRFAGVTAVCHDITDRKRAENSLQISRQKVEDLHGIAHQLMGCKSEEEVLKLIIDGTREIVEFSTCVLFLVDATMIIPKIASPASHLHSIRENGPHEKMALQTWGTQETFIFRCSEELPLKDEIPEGIQSGISLPIADLGVFQLCSTESHAFDSDDARLLELLLRHVAEALQRLRLEQALRNQAIHDYLTGVYNRHYLDQALRRELKRCERHNRPLDFLMIDVDQLKKINDSFGHHTGDRVLQKIASVLQGEIRETDVIVRYGGDEFLILLPQSNIDPENFMKRLSETATKRIAEESLVDFPVRLSVGWARWDPNRPETVDTILAEADRRMYENKRSRSTKP